jgi:hypothetical protein
MGCLGIDRARVQGPARARSRRVPANRDWVDVGNQGRASSALGPGLTGLFACRVARMADALSA